MEDGKSTKGEKGEGKHGKTIVTILCYYFFFGEDVKNCLRQLKMHLKNSIDKMMHYTV